MDVTLIGVNMVPYNSLQEVLNLIHRHLLGVVIYIHQTITQVAALCTSWRLLHTPNISV